MEREHLANDDLVELGTASVETKGPGGQIDDQVLGKLFEGLSDD